MKNNSVKARPPTVALSRKFVDAVEFAITHHAMQSRKGTTIPYIGHLLQVASSVINAGGDEDVAIAGLLHDAVEDQGGLQMLAKIRTQFGPHVGQIVKDCSDSIGEPKPPWRERKEGYIQHLSQASADVRLVAAADKLSNAMAVLSDLKAIGDKLWDRFNAPKKDQLWYYYSVVFALQDAPPDSRVAKLLDELLEVVNQIRDISEGPEVQELLKEAEFYAGASEYRRAIQFARMALAGGPESSQTADCLQLIEKCFQRLEEARNSVEEAQEDSLHHPQNGEKFFSLGLALGRAGDLDGSTVAYEQALKYKRSMCLTSLRDCLNNIGWNCFRSGDYKQSLKWFKRSLATVDPEDPQPYPLPMENMILANAELGRISVVTTLTEEYIATVGRLPQYETMIVGKLGIDADLIYILRARLKSSR